MILVSRVVDPDSDESEIIFMFMSGSVVKFWMCIWIRIQVKFCFQYTPKYYYILAGLNNCLVFF
jgi:hypothetical protein